MLRWLALTIWGIIICFIANLLFSAWVANALNKDMNKGLK